MPNDEAVPETALLEATPAPQLQPPSPSVPSSVQAPGIWRRFFDWLFVREALTKARENDATFPPARRGALKLARAHADLADSLLDAVDNPYLPPVLTLYREAFLWLLADDEAGKRALAVAMDTEPESFLAQIGQDDVRVARLRQLWAMQAYLGAGDTSAEEQRRFAEMTRASVRAMIDQVDAREPHHSRTILRKRRLRMTLAALILVAVLMVAGALGMLLFAPKDLAQGQPRRASSALPALFSANIMFHTNEELNPWFEIDLGRPQLVRSLYVKNRADCCQERAVPLLAEVSIDQSNWRQVARRDESFALWEPTFPPVRARYLRLRVPRFTALHLEQVKVY
jgi:hypothetical protein